MRLLRTAEDFVGSYGPTWRTGVLSDHLASFTAGGGTVRGRWAVLPGGKAIPIVCSEIIWIYTEDGRIDGRCGQNAGPEGVCEEHAGIREHA